MKLSDFNKKELKQMKQACIDTRAKYDGYRDHQVPKTILTEPCPLCDYDFIWEYAPACIHCPWSILEKINAIDEHCKIAKFNTQKAMTRRKRLDRWIKLIDEEIRGRLYVRLSSKKHSIR